MLAERLQLESEEERPHERPGHFSAVVKPRRARRAQWVFGSWHEHELSLRRRALEQLVRAARISERHALRDDRVDLALTEQPEQRAEVLAEPLRVAGRSEEHTSELQSLTNLVCRLLLEKKKKK